MVINILIFSVYVLIGLVIHIITEPQLNIMAIKGYSKRDFIVLFMDLFLWLLFLIVFIVHKGLTYLIKR